MLIPLSKLINDFKLEIYGVIHVGAHECEELAAYNQAGITIDKILWFEAQETKCKAMLAQNPALRIKQAIISDIDDAKVSFMVTNNSQSSSMLSFGSHAKYHPQVIEQSRFDGTTITLDTIFKRDKEDPKKYNFLNMDIQGAELLALKGAKSILPHIDYIYLEVNDEEVYKGCGLITDIDSLLTNYHFKRVATVMTDNHWGDALYIKYPADVKSSNHTDLSTDTSNKLYGQYGNHPPTAKFNDDSNSHTNGDLWFWSQIKSGVSTLIDVGVGNNLVYSWNQGLTHHCFEPNLSFYNNIKSKANAWRIINPYGLGADHNNKTVSYYNHSQSVRRRAHYKCLDDCQCKTTINISTLDQYITENKIGRAHV